MVASCKHHGPRASYAAALVVVAFSRSPALALKTYLERDSRFRIAGARNIQATGLDRSQPR